MVDDTMYDYLEVVKQLRGVYRKGDDSMALLRLQVPSGDPGNYLDIYLQSTSYADDGRVHKQIAVQEVVNGFGRRYWRYQVDPEAMEVTRHDIADTRANQRLSPMQRISQDMPPEEAIAVLESDQRITQEDIKNAQLEKAMGLNDQPVGPDEIASLRDLVQSARLPARPNGV